MPARPGQAVDSLDTPQLLIDLEVLDANLRRMMDACKVDLRVHFKSLKCAGLARHVAERGVHSFLCAKLNEAETLADAGLADILIANQIVGPAKIKRLSDLAKRASVRVCVDDADNVDQIAHAAQTANNHIGVLIEVDIGMGRCGVPPGEAAVAMAKRIATRPRLRFLGLQGYDGHLQMVLDPDERRAKCLAGLEQLIATRRLIERAGLPVEVVTGGGTGTWEWVAGYEGVTEIQPGSFLLMDCAYCAVRPEFGCALSILSSVISRRPGRYVLDAGSKAISRDFGTPVIKDRPMEKVYKLAEEHTLVDSETAVRPGEHRQVLPAHCCATMNLHRTCLGTRGGKVEAVWPIEASGRYD